MNGHGYSSLPPEKSAALKRAVRLQWISLGVMGLIIVAVGLVAGQSQAMRTAFVEDLLALLPPIAFLLGVWPGRAVPRSTPTATTARCRPATSLPPWPF